MNWLLDIQLKLKLKPRTIFLATNIFDRYLELIEVPRNKL